MAKIHSTAIVSGKAELGNNVEIAPYAVIHDDVVIGDDSCIGPHVVVYNGARIGKRVKIMQGSSVSNIPQDLKYDDEKTLFHIGDDTVIREFCTLHKGTEDTGYSKIGSNCLLMAYAHVAHDCILGNNCIIANSVQIGGHVSIGNWVIIGGSTPVHQFVKIGDHAMIGGGFRTVTDIPPFVLAAGEPLRYSGTNLIGLRRRGFSNEEIIAIKEAYSILYKGGMNLKEAKNSVREKFGEGNEYVNNILSFLETVTRPGFK